MTNLMVLGRLSSRLWRAAPRLVAKEQTRRLSLHEYQSHRLRQYGVPVPRGRVARTASEAGAAIRELGSSCVVKAQVLGGGRGDGEFDNGLRGGVQAVDSPEQGEAVAVKMLGSRLRTRHSGNQGHVVRELYVAESITFDALWYLAITIDRESCGPVIIMSKTGGRGIDAIARDHPQSLFTFGFRLSQGITPGLVSSISTELQLSALETGNLQHILERMYSIFWQKDATLLEINPLARSADGRLTCLDANFVLDKAAGHRQPAALALRDFGQEVADEVEAEKHGLVYVRMEGNIGNVVNGAGLAMATNDAIDFHGGASANFLDAGGKATMETMQQALGIVARDPRVKAIWVNVYGGLTRCDMIAESIIGAVHELDIDVPMVVRLRGTNSDEGLELLEKANLASLYVEPDFGRAAQRVVELARLAEA